MTQYRPDKGELLTSVREFLDSLAPQLDGETRYKAQVCAFLLAVCERELAAGAGPEDADRAAWSLLLGGAQGNAADLSRVLCAAIRAGNFDADFDRTLDVVLARTSEAAHLVRPDKVPAA
jgi:Domain of unknown function (DUF6285)